MKISKFTLVHGMTLIEVLIATGAASLIMGSMLYVYLASSKAVSGGFAQFQVQQAARQGIDKVLNDVRRSEQATIYSTYQGQSTFSGGTNSDAGAYIIFRIPTNAVSYAGAPPYHHYYVGNLKVLSNNITNGTLYTFDCQSDTNLSTKTADIEVIRGVTNPTHVFDWINGVVNINIRVADENDIDGKQIIYLRSAVAFRNGD